jgi:hypothetical protein
MGRYKEAPFGYQCPYQHRCPHLGGISATWASLLIREAHDDSYRNGHLARNAEAGIASLTADLERAENEIVEMSYVPTRPLCLLSRFRRIEAMGQTFTRPAEFSPETYARQAFGLVGGVELIKVRLLFEPKLAVYITERQWHPSQEFRMRPDGRVELRLETTGRKELVRWILSWMPDVKVLAPRSLRDRVAEKLRDGLRAQE